MYYISAIIHRHTLYTLHTEHHHTSSYYLLYAPYIVDGWMDDKPSTAEDEAASTAPLDWHGPARDKQSASTGQPAATARTIPQHHAYQTQIAIYLVDIT